MPTDTVSQIRIDWPDTRIYTDLPQYIQSIVQQVPPMYSALHIDGERAYTRVRSGEVFDIPPRPVHIQDVRILGIDFPCIHIQSTLSSGGYIRSLAPMISGYMSSEYMSEGHIDRNFGYIQNLRRTALLCGTGDMDISLSTPLLDIDIGQSIPYEKIFPHIPMYPLYVGADED
jgi:tRNA pseudouridine(55) synthase